MHSYLDEWYNLYLEECLDLNIGYGFNKKRIDKMYDLMYVVDYLSKTHTSENEIQIF